MKCVHSGIVANSRVPCIAIAVGTVWLCLLPSLATAQLPNAMIGQALPRDVREMYDRGLKFLMSTQSESGNWEGGQVGPGVTGMCLMTFLASGEDPNFGIYSNVVRRAVRSIIRSQDPTTGYLGPSMYHHGFAMLGLAEACGAVDDRRLWEANEPNQRTIADALRLAVQCALTSQKKNPRGAWRYSPGDTEADTSVSGAVLVGLLAARNAGINVPTAAIDRGIAYYVQMTAASGQVAYSGGMGGFDESFARISIGTLVYSLAKRKDLPQFRATLDYLTARLEASNGRSEHYAEYTRYYQAQALFQGDVESWEKWNKLLVRRLKAAQSTDGRFSSGFGDEVGTSLSLLALALNYRLLPIYER